MILALDLPFKFSKQTIYSAICVVSKNNSRNFVLNKSSIIILYGNVSHHSSDSNCNFKDNYLNN